MSNLFPLSVIKMPVPEGHNPTCAEILDRVKDLKGFIGPNRLYKAELHNELLQRVSCCFKDIVKNINISLSIPNFMKSEAVLKNINCKKDLQKLKALCAHHLESTKETTPEQNLVPASTVPKEKGFGEILDPKLLNATELVASSKPLMNELNKKVYLSKCGKRLIQKFKDITRGGDGSFSDVVDRSKRRSMALKKIALREIMKYDSLTSVKEEKTPPESFYIRQEYLQTQITERRARTKEFERLSDLESGLQKVEHEFYVGFNKMAYECNKQGPIRARLNADIKTLEAIYQATVKRNLEAERKLIRERAKLLSQISNWIQKYDKDIALKLYTLNMVKEELQEQKEVAEEFYKEYNRLSAEYSEVVQYQLVQARLEEFREEMARKRAAKEKRAGKK